MKRWYLLFPAALAALMLIVSGGCASLDEKQRAWIFQPTDRTWDGAVSAAQGMEDAWIPFDSKVTGEKAKLHALWLPAADPKAPVLLYLHGVRWNVIATAPRMRHMNALGFSVLSIDYRGFGRSSPGLPSEAMAYEDARAAWDWLAAKYPDRPRYIFGHSLGGAVAIDLAAQVSDERGTIVEGTFTSIPDVAGSMRWGWLPFGALVTQRFDAVSKVARIGSPLLVVHGTDDNTISPELGRKLFDAARGPKEFMLVEGGSHHSTNGLGMPQYREAMVRLFGLGAAQDRQANSAGS